jgi:hypothetical protein
MNGFTDQMNNPTDSSTASITELTKALEDVIQKLAISVPQKVSIFFDGTEVYRHQPEDGRVFWWGADDTSAITPVSLVPDVRES